MPVFRGLPWVPSYGLEQGRTSQNKPEPASFALASESAVDVHSSVSHVAAEPEPMMRFRLWHGPGWRGFRAACLVWILLSAAGIGAEVVPAVAAVNPITEATNHLGQWIWDAQTMDKQTCRLWKSFVIPPGAAVARATLRITVDNGYRLFLDGREIGRGSDWKTVTEYDVTWLLNAGAHVLAVEGFNDRLQAGLILGLRIELMDQSTIDVLSDQTWRIVPASESHWEARTKPAANWPLATVVGKLGTPPWNSWPYGVIAEPGLRPVTLRFWQALWFQISLLVACGLALLGCLWLATQLAIQARSQRLLQLERERIARDIHDDLGARFTQMVLLAEIAKGELPANSESSAQLQRICEDARSVSQAMDEVVWAVNSRRDTVRDFANFLCKFAQAFLKDTPIRCRLDVEPDLPLEPFDLAIRRNLLLAAKEAINNAAKHSGASELILRIHRHTGGLRLVVEDNGKGFELSLTDPGRNGLSNMAQRMEEAGGRLDVSTAPDRGCRIEFSLPHTHARRYPRWLTRLFGGRKSIPAMQNPRLEVATEVKVT